jgi:hypothetical protein
MIMNFSDHAKKWMQDTERQIGREPSDYPDRVKKWLAECDAEANPPGQQISSGETANG